MSGLHPIDTLDAKGHTWTLFAPPVYRSNPHQTEVWLLTSDDRPAALKGYVQIPVPVFTDWWPV